MSAVGRPITEAELALIQMVVDARDDQRRVPDAMIRSYAQRVALEAVSAETLDHLQALYNQWQQAKADFSVAFDELPNYARRPTMAKLEATWNQDAAPPPAEVEK